MLSILKGSNAPSDWCNKQRNLGHSVGFVPTMGALHAGHLSLVERSIAENDVTCVSIFVNPLQFNDPSDYSCYPRNFELDCERLESKGCEMVFTGEFEDIFPQTSSPANVKALDPGIFGQELEGKFRPGHLSGVCTVVDRLFRIVGTGRAYFGLKDYQQLLVVRHLAERLGYPNVIGCETVRDKNGLALSSRNELLSKSEVKSATKIFAALSVAKTHWQSGCQDCDTLRELMIAELGHELKVDYADLRNPCNWQKNSPTGKLDNAIALIAAWVGNVRLIDNLRLDDKTGPN